MRKCRNLSRLIIILLLFCHCQVGFGQVKTSYPEFTFWTVGNSVVPRLGNDWYTLLDQLNRDKDHFHCLLQKFSTGAKTKEDLINNCSISADWLNQTLDQLLKHSCIDKTDNSEYFTKIPVATEEQMNRIQEDLKPIARKVAEEIKKSVPQLKEAYNESKGISDPDWEYVSHLVLDKFLVDGFFHRGLSILQRERGIKKYYSKDQNKIPVFFLENESEYGTFGVNWYGLGDKNVYVLHGAPLKRFYITFNNYGRKKSFFDVFQRIGADGSVVELSNEEIQIFKELCWIKNNKLSIPFIESQSLKTLKNDLEDIGNAGANIVFDNFSIIMDSYERSSYFQNAEGAGDYIQVCYHLLFTGIINELMEMEVLPKVPEPLPEDFGVYITSGSFWDD